MHDRSAWPKKKTEMYSNLQELPSKYSVMALIRMEKIRASQMLSLRKKLKNEVQFVSIKNKVTKKVFSTLDLPGLKEITSQVTGQCMLLFTNMSPFKLNVLLAKNKVMLAARGGDKASIDVLIQAKNTGIAPGPMLTEFKEAKVPTKIDQGTIWIAKDTVAAKQGEVISAKLAALLGKLDIKSVEAGVELAGALESGVVYTRDDLVVDVEVFRTEIAHAHQEALSLSIEAGYVTVENIKTLLSHAAQGALSVASESGYISKDTAERVLQKANANARALESSASDYKTS